MRVNTLYSTKEVLTEQGQAMELRYYLIQDIRSRAMFRQEQGREMTGDSSCQEDRITYGIRIVKTENGTEEQECLSGLSASLEQVERLLRQMIYGLVTPVTAMAVADDWLSAC